MANVVSVNEVQQVAVLARIQLRDDEVTRLSGQLNDILKYVQQLQAIPVTNVPPTSHVLALSNVTRPDQSQPSVRPDEVLAIAPARHGQLYKVPKIIET